MEDRLELVLQPLRNSQVDFDPRSTVESALSQEDATPWELLCDEGIEPKIFLAAASLFWPTLIEIDGLIFIKENYDKEQEKRLRETIPYNLIEETVNTTYLYDFFKGHPESIESSRVDILGRILEKSWTEWAERQFPGRHFEAKFCWYTPPDDDPGITLYQRGPA